jgi:ABC-type spermidine/putrescine transport system permease subunit I
MAFKAGKWRGLMMICVIAPFFTSFILRTIAWRQILADEGPVAKVAQHPAPAARRPSPRPGLRSSRV